MSSAAATARDPLVRLGEARRALVAGAWLSALLWGAVCVAGFALVLLLALLLISGSAARMTTREAWLAGAAALVAGITTAALRLRRGARPSLVDVALWAEAREPRLRYALVTVADLAERRQPAPAGLADAAATGEWPAAARVAALRAVAVPAAVLLCVAFAAAFAAVHLTADARSAPVGGAPNERVSAAAAGARRTQLTPLAADVAPPAYTGLRATTLREPATIAALVGSTITLRGEGGARPIRAALGDAAPSAASAANGAWTVRLTMPPRTSVLRLSDDAGSRVIVLESVRDSAPNVVLTLPARDTVLRTASGTFALSADATDDFGIASAQFEYIVSSGEGESFTFKSGVLGVARSPGRVAHLRASISVDSLGLKPGDLVHLRAVARDANAVGGPSTGSSETRTLRVMRAGEADSVAVEAAAPADADKSVVSQRMLLMLTEALEKRRPKLARPALLDESQRISVDQTRLRKSVGEIVFSRLGGQPSGEESAGDDTRPRTPDEVLKAAEAATNSSGGALDFEGDETPVVSVNRPLLEAYNAMWDAGRALDAGEPARAIPPMRAALAAIQRSRQAERIYLRGRPPAVVVDVARARLQGKDHGQGSERVARPAADPGAALRAARFARALESLGSDPAAAVDSLQLLRVDALDAAPRAAAAIGDAVELLRTRRDATDALVRARRLLDGGAEPAPVGAWGRAW